jgi:competence protein ComEC
MRAYRFHISLTAFLVGVGAGTMYAVSVPVVAWMSLVGLGLLAVGCRRSEASSAPIVISCSLILVFFTVGLLRINIAAQQFGHSSRASSVGEKVELVGQVIKEPDVREKAAHLYVQVESDTILVTTDRYVNVSYGDEVQVVGTLEEPESFASELGREFNYPAYLLARGVEYQISFANIELVSSGNGSRFISYLFIIKHTLMRSIEALLVEPQAGLGEGLLLGVKQALGEELEAAFRTSGIIHIVVLSGQNVMLVVMFTGFVLSFFLPKRAQLAVGLALVTCFALMVGLSATVMRASLMAGLIIIAQFLGRTYDLTRGLLFAGAFMVLINPYVLLYDLGFQFSFMATLGLILIAPKFETFISDGFSKFSIKDFIVATLATQVAVLPLLLYHIGEVSLVAVAVNVLVMPIVPLAMLSTFLAGAVGVVSTTLALPFAFVAHVVLSYIIQVALFFSSVPLASVVVPPFPAYGVFALYVLIGLLVWKLQPKRVVIQRDTLDGWTIEEEVEKVGETQSVSPTSPSTPVFFR